MNKSIEILRILMLVVFISVLLGRSILHSYRIFREFKNPPKIEKLVNTCLGDNVFSTIEDERLYYYSQIGTICEK